MKRLLKRGLYILSISTLVGIMASCLGKDDKVDIFPLTDAELLAFWLSHADSLPELSKVVFTIEHGSSVGRIYNNDSMPYMTKLPEKVFIGYISGSGMDNILNITTSDSIWVNQNDSINMSVPQTLQVHALDGKTKKLYIAQLNIHQINPDSLQFHHIATDMPFSQCEESKTVTFNDRFLTYFKIDDKILLYSSQDAETWNSEGLAGLPGNTLIKEIKSNGKQLFAFTDLGDLYVRDNIVLDEWVLVNIPPSIKIKSILGYLNDGPKQKEGLCLVIETDGVNTFAFTNDLIQWEFDSNIPVPNDFPLYEFSSHSYSVMLTERITIFGGISSDGSVQNTVWSTETGRYWAKLTNDTNVFPSLVGANVIYYDNEFWLFNGKSGDKYNGVFYYSTDGGITWWLKMCKNYFPIISSDGSSGDTTEDFPDFVEYGFPDNYSLRYDASVIVDKNKKYFYIIGGKQDTDVSASDMWKVFVNKKEFKQ